MSYKNTIAIFFSLLLVGCNQEEIIFNDEKGHWELFGLDSISVTKIVVADSFLYACAGPKGLFRKHIKSQSEWKYLGFGNAISPEIEVPWYDGVTDVDIKKNNILVSFIGYVGVTLDRGIGIWKSIDNGISFFKSDSGIVQGNTLWSYANSVARSDINQMVGVAVWGRIYKTTNDGVTWYCPDPNSYYGDYNTWKYIKWHPRRADRLWLYGASHPSFLLASSSDAGETWNKFKSEDIGIPHSCFVFDMAFDAVHPNVVYVATCPTLLKSTDNGKTWFYPFGKDMPLIRTIATHPTKENYIYFSTGTIVYFSNGFKYKSIGSPNNKSINSMVVDPSSDLLYIATDQGIFRYYKKSCD
ncbi:MAG: hypothetical protein QME52_06260 [Bacteroidota bacterium]|nr:hypothetical protein [Bacteroidota bacterium]